MSEDDAKKDECPDGGYGWFIVLSAFIVNLITDGMMFSFGILLIEFITAFDQSRASTAFIGATATALMHLVGPLAASLSDIYGNRVVATCGSIISCVGLIASSFATSLPVLYITYGVLGGLGFGLMYLPANACVVKYFTKQRSLAVGLSVCGSGAGTFAFNVLTRYILDIYGWRGTMLLLAGILLHGVACGLLLKDPPKRKFQDQYIVVNSTDIPEEHVVHYSVESKQKFNCKTFFTEMLSINLLRDPRCICFLLSVFALNLGFVVPFSLLPDQVIETGMEEHEAAWLVSSIGITNIVSRILVGWLGDKRFVNRTVMLEVMSFLAGLSTAVSPLLTTFQTKLIYTCLYGFFIGGYVTLCPLVLADMFGADMIAQSFGLVMFSVGLSGLIAAPVGGLIFDLTGSYDISFVLAGCGFIIAGVLLLLPNICKRLC